MLCFQLLPLSGLAAIFPHEKLELVVGKGYQAQALIYYRQGKKDKPLVVFIPGDANLARIAYGWPAGRKENFLAYWIHRLGYSFLAISYPIANPVFDHVYPGLSIANWADMNANIISTLREKKKITQPVVIMAWSMAGKVLVALSTSLHKKHIGILSAVSLSATVPFLNNIPGQSKTIKRGRYNLADRISIRKERFTQSIRDQNSLNNQKVIPVNVYQSEFIGDPPVALIGTQYFYNKRTGRFYQDFAQVINNTRMFHYEDMPLVIIIRGDSQADPQHALIDQYTWGLYNEQSMYRKINRKLNKDFYKLSKRQWSSLQSLFSNMPQSLCYRIHGGHFFFVGEKGAHRTALSFEKGMDKIRIIKQKMDKLTYVSH